MAHQNIIREQKIDRLSKMIFNLESTMKTDYQKLDLRKEPKTVYVPKPAKPKEERKEIPNPSYVYTMTRWKYCVAPFDMHIHPDPVHGFDPRVAQQPFEEIGDPDREKAYKTRPRLIMTPAASLDDIEDPVAREIIINDTYISTLNVAQRPTAAEAFPVDKNVTAPLGDSYAPTKPQKTTPFGQNSGEVKTLGCAVGTRTKNELKLTRRDSRAITHTPNPGESLKTPASYFAKMKFRRYSFYAGLGAIE